MATEAMVHDTFNIFFISLLNILNLLNWHLDVAHWAGARLSDDGAKWSARWSGEYQNIFLAATYAYSILDTLAIIVVPTCVDGPKPIIFHHLAVIVALTVPLMNPNTHGYALGVFMFADFNTIFLILRKKMLDMKKVSSSALLEMAFAFNEACFYATWVVVRLMLYPAWLYYLSVPEWQAGTDRTGSVWNVFVIMPIISLMIVLLNFGWTTMLLRSSIRRMRKKSKNKDA